MRDVVSILGRLGRRRGCVRARRPPAALGAAAQYERGVALEATDPAAARAAYAQALRLAPAFGDAASNLGRLDHAAGAVAEAEAWFRLAVCADPRVAVYWFNLGVACEDQGRAAEAIAAYREALARDPELPEAHFNLARLYQRAAAADPDTAREAARHWHAYRRARRG